MAEEYVQTLTGGPNGPDTSAPSATNNVVHQLNFTDANDDGIYDEGDTVFQEPYAANVIVDAYKVWNGVAEATPTARFLTGADGNYYFDLDVQGDLAQTKTLGSTHFGQTIEYQIRATDPLGRQFLNDINTTSMSTSNPTFTYLPHYASSWTINANWFFSADHDNPLLLGNNPGEIFFDPSGNTANVQGLVNPTDLPELSRLYLRTVAWNNFGHTRPHHSGRRSRIWISCSRMMRRSTRLRPRVRCTPT